MPVYDYRCNACGSLYDVYHKTKEIAEDVLCPSCGSREYKKLMSIPGIAVSNSSRSESAGPCTMGDDCCGGACSMN